VNNSKNKKDTMKEDKTKDEIVEMFNDYNLIDRISWKKHWRLRKKACQIIKCFIFIKL